MEEFFIITAPAFLAAAWAIVAFIRDYRAGRDLSGWKPDWFLLLCGGAASLYVLIDVLNRQ